MYRTFYRVGLYQRSLLDDARRRTRMIDWDGEMNSRVRCVVADDDQARRDWPDVRARVVRYLSATVGQASPMGFGWTTTAAASAAVRGTARNRLRRFIHQSAADDGARTVDSRCGCVRHAGCERRTARRLPRRHKNDSSWLDVAELVILMKIINFGASAASVGVQNHRLRPSEDELAQCMNT